MFDSSIYSESIYAKSLEKSKQENKNNFDRVKDSKKQMIKQSHEGYSPHQEYKGDREYSPQISPILRKVGINPIGQAKQFQRSRKDLFEKEHLYGQEVKSIYGKTFNHEAVNLQEQLTKHAANQIIHQKQKELYEKQANHHKQEIKYLNEKCQKLQQQNSQIIQSNTRLEILEREYPKLVKQIQENQKSNYQSNRTYTHFEPNTNGTYIKAAKYIKGTTNDSLGKLLTKQHIQNTSNENEYFNQIPSETIEKLGWRKTTSPSYKRKQLHSPPYRADDVESQSLLESNLKKTYFSPEREDQISHDFRTSKVNNDFVIGKYQSKYQLERSIQMEDKINKINAENVQLRLTLSKLHQKIEDIQKDQLKYLENISQLKSQKKYLHQNASKKEQEIRRQQEQNTIIKEQFHIKILEFQESIKHYQESIKYLNLEKQEFQTIIERMKLEQMKAKQDLGKAQEYENIKKQKGNLQAEISELTSKIKALEDQLKKMHNFNQSEKINHQKISIENKINIQQFRQKQQAMNIEMQKIKLQVSELIKNNKFLQQKSINLQKQLGRKNNENSDLERDFKKLYKLIESHEKERNEAELLRSKFMRLNELIKTNKRVDATVDHLWSVKEIQYCNINKILEEIHFLKK